MYAEAFSVLDQGLSIPRLEFHKIVGPHGSVRPFVRPTGLPFKDSSRSRGPRERNGGRINFITRYSHRLVSRRQRGETRLFSPFRV